MFKNNNILESLKDTGTEGLILRPIVTSILILILFINISYIGFILSGGQVLLVALVIWFTILLLSLRFRDKSLVPILLFISLLYILLIIIEILLGMTLLLGLTFALFTFTIGFLFMVLRYLELYDIVKLYDNLDNTNINNNNNKSVYEKYHQSNLTFKPSHNEKEITEESKVVYSTKDNEVKNDEIKHDDVMIKKLEEAILDVNNDNNTNTIETSKVSGTSNYSKNKRSNDKITYSNSDSEIIYRSNRTDNRVRRKRDF